MPLALNDNIVLIILWWAFPGCLVCAAYIPIMFHISNSIKAFTSEKCTAYRTGGDEFVMICPEPKNGQKEKIVSDWQKAIAAVPNICGVPVTAAVGFAEGGGNELEQVIRTAEQNMYADKQRYH